MKVALVVLESFYQNPLALDYLRLYALEDPEVRASAEITTHAFPPGVEDAAIVCELLNSNPEVVGFCTYLWNINKTYSIAETIRTQCPDIFTLFGGLEVSYDALEVLQSKPFINAVVQGEGEVPFREILRSLLRGERLFFGLPGVWSREDGTIHCPDQIEIVQNLDDIPSPFLSADFNPEMLTGDVLYESYRGCVFTCAFCLYHRDYTKQRYYSMERIRKDLEVLLASPCQSIRFVDSTFNIHPRRTKEILQILEGTSKRVSVEVSAEFFDEETIEMLPRAGIRQIDIGLQSATKKVLDTVSRKFYREEPFKRNLELLRKHPEITLNVELIAGLPGDYYDSFKRSIDFAVAQRPDHVSIYRLLLLKGSELRRRAGEFGMTFDLHPPYALIESKDFSAADLDRLELLSFSHIVLYNSGVATWALLASAKRYSVEPTVLYERFLDFCLNKKLYSEGEIRDLAQWYAVGNRFDYPRPENFSLECVQRVSLAFFQWLARCKGDEDFKRTYNELIDYGYQLARLDFHEHKAKINTGVSTNILSCPKIADHGTVKEYSPSFFDVISSLGNSFGDIAPEEAVGIAFFYRPNYGPTTLVLNCDLYHVLQMCDGRHDVKGLSDRLAEQGFQNKKQSLHALNQCIDALVAQGLIEETS